MSFYSKLAKGLAALGYTSSSGSGIATKPEGWSAALNAKLSLSSTQLVKVGVVGDSLSAGAYCSSINSKSWFALLIIALQAKYGDGGSGFRSMAACSLTLASPASIGNMAADQGQYVMTGGWQVAQTLLDGPGATVIAANAVGGTIANTRVRGTTVEIYYLTDNNANRASFTVTIDGVSKGAVTTNTGVKGIGKSTFTGLSNANHNVVITNTDGDGTTKFLSICGFAGYNANGVVGQNFARGGFTAEVFDNNTANTVVMPLGSFGGSGNGSYGPAGKWSGGSANPVDILIYGFNGLNDTTQNRTPDQFDASVRNFISDVMDGGTQNGSTVLAFVMQHGGKLTNVEGAGKYFQQYQERLSGIAKGYNAATFNLWALGKNSWNYYNSLGYWGTTSPLGNVGTDDLHYGDAGHAAVGSYMVSVFK